MRELRRIILKLSLKSHAPIQGYEFAPSEVGRGDRWRKSDRRAPVPHLGQHQAKSGGTRMPRGGIDRQGDRTPEYRQKSHAYFEQRLKRIQTLEGLRALLKEAEEALEAWTRTPQVAGVDPERESFYWKCAIADDKRPMEDILRQYSVSRATVFRYRLKYRGLRAAGSAATLVESQDD